MVCEASTTELENPVIDLTPHMDGTINNLTFTTINDATPNSSSSAPIDNVSINAVVPDPTSVGALWMLSMFARRRGAVSGRTQGL